MKIIPVGRWHRERGVSPVIGVILMTGIVVLLAVTVATLVTGFDSKLRDPAPSGGFDQKWNPTGQDNTNDRPYVTIRHEVGQTVDAENIYITDESGNEVRWDNVWTGGPEVHAGEYVHIDGFASDSALDPICSEGDTYTIIVRNDDGETLLVNKWTAPNDPDLPSGSASDSNGDGIPDWC